MKKFIFILGLVLIAAALVAAGWWLGYRERFFTDAYAITTLDKQITDASIKSLLLHQIDSGHPEEARKMLRLELDGDILTINTLMDYSDARSRDLASKVFARIASYRSEYPGNYTNEMPEVDAKIAEILRRATQDHSK